MAVAWATVQDASGSPGPATAPTRASSIERGRQHAVRNAAELKRVLPRLAPGDTVVLADGTWTDADLLFRAAGTPDAPITLRAQTPGGVVLTGASRLRIAGAHLVVDGLLFRGGALPGGAGVVEFRDGDGRPATNCRLTNSAIIDYNPLERLADYKWVSLYGTDNRVDHCRFAGKNHQGALLVVWLDGKPNRHRIDRNFFGPRPPHDRNGAETIRIGTSDWSMTESATVVEENYFYRCDGEQEIISSKSWRNVFRNNTFVECQGALTLRHGNACVVAGNFFLGRGREQTGGVRLIGEDHRVCNNHFEGLTGDGFHAALSIVLGIPDSPLNGYFQVRRAEVVHNTFVDNAHTMVLGIMFDRPEAVLPPVDCVIANNAIIAPRADFVEERTAGVEVRFAGNLAQVRGGAATGAAGADGTTAGAAAREGIRFADLRFERGPDGVSRPAAGSPVIDAAAGDFPFVTEDLDGERRAGSKDVGADEWSPAPPRRPLTPAEVGPSWAVDAPR